MFPNELQHRIAYINVVSLMGFGASLRYWRNNSDSELRWVTLHSQPNPVLIGHDDGLELDCDSASKISAPYGGVIHVNGDLCADLEIGDLPEVILAGDVQPDTTIHVSGIARIYIGGGMHGRILSHGSSIIWIDGDFTGSIETGTPSTGLHIAGDFSGEISPRKDAALLWMSIGGYADNGLISRIFNIGYSDLKAAIARSNVRPGLYPTGVNYSKTESGSWSVLAQDGE